MKLDIDYIKQILQIMEEHKNTKIDNDELMKKLGITSRSTDDLEKLYNHINDLREIACIEYEDSSVGWNRNGYQFCLPGIYKINHKGRELLEIMKNDTWWNKIKNTGKDMTIETLKQAPALIMSTLLSYIK